MSLISQILNSLTGKKEENESIIYPCQNCESNCAVYPNACSECKPYKEKLVNALYNVEHIDAFYAKYVIVTEGEVEEGTVVCPYCGASTGGTVCEYCGSKIGESDGKIKVTSANDIPNPIIEARDIIYQRRALIDKYSDTSDTSSSGGIINSIVSAFTGKTEETENSLGSVMTESEIKAMAEKYSVSVKEYLEGLDTGSYKSKTAYEKEQTISTSAQTATVLGTGAAAGYMLGNHSSGVSHNPPPMNNHNSKPSSDNRPPMNNGNRPPMNGQNRPQTNGQNRPDTGHGRPDMGARPGQNGRGTQTAGKNNGISSHHGNAPAAFGGHGGNTQRGGNSFKPQGRNGKK